MRVVVVIGYEAATKAEAAHRIQQRATVARLMGMIGFDIVCEITRSGSRTQG